MPPTIRNDSAGPGDAAARRNRDVQRILDALPAHLAILDRHGTIIEVNQPWVRFAAENGLPDTRGVCEGADYLGVCRKAADVNDPFAQEAMEGIEAVVRGQRSSFAMEYPCHSPCEQRWFLMEVRGCDGADATVISHINITDRKRADEALEKRLVALTRPLDDPRSIVFEDLFSLDEIQDLQDEFAKATGVASIITHVNGTPITRPSNFCRLCSTIIRKTEKGLANCFRSDAEIGCFRPDGPTIRPCLSGGLWDAGAAISVGGQHIANWLIGQVRDETQTEEKMRQYAWEIGADEEAVVEAFRQVPAMSRWQFGQVAKALFTLARLLSNIAYQNVQQARFITERKRAEEQLLQAQKMEAVGRLAGGVAHDFRNQLQVILGFGEILLRESLVKEEGRKMLEEILRAGKRSATTTGQLLAYSRREVLHPAVQSIRDCVAEIGKLLPRIIGEDIHLIIRSGNADGQSTIDSHLLQQAIMNLATNARDSMPKGGSLTIETDCVTLDEARSRGIDHELAAGQYVVVSVSDTGTGMGEAILARIFEPYFTTKDVNKGSGLGLPMVYGFVKQSGGAVAVQSEPGQGTTVRLYFPRVVPASVNTTGPQEVRTSPGGNETILVAEDEPSVLSVAARLLREAGYRVLEAASAEEALALVDRNNGSVGLLVADIVMPGMTGAALAERLCARYPGLGVLYISGYPGEELARRGVNETADILLKPFTSESLLTKVRRVLDARKASS